ncbi:MAG: DUF1003 domain-containing protein [Chloroflexota bacterium]
MGQPEATTICPACGEKRPAEGMTPGRLLPPTIVSFLQRLHPHWSSENRVCRFCINQAKAARLQTILEKQMGPLPEQATQVIDAIRQQSLVAFNPHEEMTRQWTAAERLADRVAAVVGSYRFSATILLALATWIGINVMWRPFEPYPIVILAGISAALGSLAALQGPVILMAQRRQARLDRLRAENDYRVNLKAELEIRYLDEKLDHLLRMNTDTRD